MRNILTVAASIGLSLATVGAVQAGGHVQVGRSSGSTHSSFSRGGMAFVINPHFNYVKLGLKSVSYSHRVWSEHYGCYQYWSPASSCWYFYVPAYASYIPWQYFGTVYQAPFGQSLINQAAPATPPIPLTNPAPVDVLSINPGGVSGPIGPPAPPN